MGSYITDRKGQITIFAVMAMSFFLDGLDGTIVTVALPDIGRSFGMTTAESSWVVTVYFMVMAGLILIFGKMSEKGALKKILIAGFTIFSLSSLMCALSDTSWMLILSRGIQGVGSAMLAATGIMMGVRFIPPEKMKFGMSLTVLGSSIGAAIGPAVGGVLTQCLSWHWIFIINVPIGLICALFAAKVVPKDEHYQKGNFDVLGSIVLFLMIVCGLYAIESIPSKGLDTYSSMCLIACIILLLVFIFYELRSKENVLDVRLFGNLRFDGAAIAFIILNACFMGALYLIPFMLQIEMGVNTAESGALMLIQAAVTLVLCLPMGRAADLHGTRRYSVIGCLILTLTFSVFAVLNKSYGLLPISLAIGLLGSVWGIAGGSIGPRLIEVAPDDKKDSCSSILSFIVYFGSALGTALFSALFNIGSGAQGCEISDLAPEVFMNGFTFTMIVGAVLAAVACLLSSMIRTNSTPSE